MSCQTVQKRVPLKIFSCSLQTLKPLWPNNAFLTVGEGRAQVSPPEGREGCPGSLESGLLGAWKRRAQKGGHHVWESVHLAALRPTQAMIFLLALVSSGLASPVDKYEAKTAELRALLESGGPADIGGSWTPSLTPEVKVKSVSLAI